MRLELSQVVEQKDKEKLWQKDPILRIGGRSKCSREALYASYRSSRLSYLRCQELCQAYSKSTSSKASQSQKGSVSSSVSYTDDSSKPAVRKGKKKKEQVEKVSGTGRAKAKPKKKKRGKQRCKA